jgi:hypothetical protein
MEKEGRAKKLSANKEMGLSQGFPLDLNLLQLQNSKNKEQINHPHVALNNSSSISQRNRRKGSRGGNKEAVKLGYSKSCEVPMLLLDEPRVCSKQNAKRSFSAPDALAVPAYGMERFNFERPLYEHRNTAYVDRNKEELHTAIDDNLHLSFKLPAIRIHSTHCKKQGLNGKNKTASTAGKDYRLPYVKNKSIYRY